MHFHNHRNATPPTEVLLSWPTPNYDHPVTRGNALLVVNSVLITLVIITVGLRLYTRLVIKRWFGLDDVFILLAMVFTIALTAVVLVANQRFGWDRHVYDIPFNQFIPTSKIAMTAKVVFTAAATFTRLSLHCFYYRLVSDTGKRWFQYMIHANVIYTIGIFVSFTFLAIFLCTPVKNYWMIGAPKGSCIDEGVATLVCGIINCVADFFTTITPIPLVMGLHMPRRQRFAVAFLFGMGIIVTVAGIIRTWYIYKSLIVEYDQTWHAYPLWIAAAVEIDLGVICASAPVLRPLLAKIPFSLSETFSRGFPIKKSANSSANVQMPKASRSAPESSTISSERRSETIRGAPDSNNDRGKSYEMKHWPDVEAIIGNGLECGSQDGILENEGERNKKRSVARMWDKVRAKDSKKHMKEDMTITRTSEVQLQIEPATGQNSRRSSWISRHREKKRERPLPQLPKFDQ
ncbi:hypothetical protein BKA66DRAFT_564681 [Pyrenochaeta sp. MPI-SDFR-AT-0127]|nr:hypothetical protein BKA66DRAFT_564681 [Pyrenochaeta sp. MPI-SDFR-AT-0127]